MDLKNTTLDDVCAVVGFSATLRLVAWFGDRAPMYVPLKVQPGQLIVKLLGLPAATALTNEWPGEYLRICRIKHYEVDRLRQQVSELVEGGDTLPDVAQKIGISKNRVSQICAELQRAGLAPEKYRRKRTPKVLGKDSGQKRGVNDSEKSKVIALPPGFFDGDLRKSQVLTVANFKPKFRDKSKAI